MIEELLGGSIHTCLGPQRGRNGRSRTGAVVEETGTSVTIQEPFSGSND